MNKCYLVLDQTAGNIAKLCFTDEALIGYANEAHFVLNNADQPLADHQTYACSDVNGAVAILEADMFNVVKIQVNQDIVDISKYIYEERN